jgi:hypothetical protein
MGPEKKTRPFFHFRPGAISAFIARTSTVPRLPGSTGVKPPRLACFSKKQYH